jgi:hypothetical protein
MVQVHAKHMGDKYQAANDQRDTTHALDLEQPRS